MERKQNEDFQKDNKDHAYYMSEFDLKRQENIIIASSPH